MPSRTAPTPVPLQFQPMVVKDKTPYAAKGFYVDSSGYRFVEEKPQMIGGWTSAISSTVIGVPRAIFAWNDLTNDKNTGIGTNKKYYVEKGGGLRDVTPARATATLTNPFTTTGGLPTVTVAHTAHGAATGDYVTFSGASAVGGLTLNAEYVLTVIDANSYTITASSNASSSVPGGGGASVSAEYQLSTGPDSYVSGSGWGAGSWGHTGGWGSAASTTTFASNLRVWTHDNFGNKLIICPRGGGIYEYDPASPARAVNLTSIGGASDVPTVADGVLVAPGSRQLFAFGCNPIGTSTADPMMVRWTDYENEVNWTPAATNAAGGLRLGGGSKFIAAVIAKSYILIFYDAIIYVSTWVGGSGAGVWGFDAKAKSITLLGPKAAVAVGDSVYFMTKRGFYAYDGTIRHLPLPVTDWVFRRLDTNAAWRCFASSNALFSEVWFWYQKKGDTDVNDYVIYNYETGSVSIGTNLQRGCWLDRGVHDLPRAMDNAGQMWTHENGLNAGTGAMNAYIESSYVDVADGQSAQFIKTFWPDIDFLDSTNNAPSPTITIKIKNKPGSDLQSPSFTGSIIETSTTAYTPKIDVGKRGRSAAFRIESNQNDVTLRVGSPRVLIKSDGLR